MSIIETTNKTPKDLMKNDKILYLIDGSAYIYRAYHAIRGLTDTKGRPGVLVSPPIAVYGGEVDDEPARG